MLLFLKFSCLTSISSNKFGTWSIAPASWFVWFCLAPSSSDSQGTSLTTKTKSYWFSIIIIYNYPNPQNCILQLLIVKIKLEGILRLCASDSHELYSKVLPLIECEFFGWAFNDSGPQPETNFCLSIEYSRGNKEY